MKPRTLPQTAFLVVAVIFLITGDAFSQIERGVDSIWNDPVFKRQFIAGYGINSDIEPRVASRLSETPAASWFLVATFFWVPFVFAACGAYAGAVRGLVVGLAEQLMELGVVPFLYAVVRPALTSAATQLAATGRRAPGGQSLSVVRKAIDERILQTSEAMTAQMGPPSGLGDRIQRKLSQRAQGLLCHAAVRAALQRGSKQADAVVELEQLGIERLSEALGGSLMGAMKLHVVLAYGGALVLGVLPYAVYIGLR